jgi:hypothetical protein
LLARAHDALAAQDLTPTGVRSDPAAAAGMSQTASWLMDMAANVIAEQGAALGLSDPDWTAFIDAANSTGDQASGSAHA